MSNKTKYDIWCLDNQIGNGDLFLDNLKSAGKVDSRFLELYNELLIMNNEYAEIEPGITDLKEFEQRMCYLYGYGFDILDKHLILIINFEDDLNKSDEAIRLAFELYTKNYNEFIRKLNNWYSINTQNNIMNKVREFEIKKYKEILNNKVDFTKLSRLPYELLEV